MLYLLVLSFGTLAFLILFLFELLRVLREKEAQEEALRQDEKNQQN